MRPSVCLTAIVRDEEKNIEDWIASARKICDKGVVVDTGSTDQTCLLVDQSGMDVILEHRPWIDYSTNRNQAIELARTQGADLLLALDADDRLEIDEYFEIPTGDAPGYRVKHLLGSTSFWRVALFRPEAGWRYRGRVHETLVGPVNNLPLLQGIQIRCNIDGEWRSRERLIEDERILEEEIYKNNYDTRSWFYLAQTRYDLGRWESARSAYLARSSVKDNPEEVFTSLYRVGQCSDNMGKECDAECEHAYVRAHEARPHRVEPLWALARHHRMRGRFHAALPWAQVACQTRGAVDDLLFVDEDVQTGYKPFDELSVVAWWCGRTNLARYAVDRALELGVPAPDKKRVEDNRALILGTGGVVLTGEGISVDDNARKLARAGILARVAP